MDRRTVLKGGIAVALTAHTAVASGEALPSTLDTLISEHKRMMDVDSAAWDRAGDLEASIENHKLPKVQTSTLFQGRDAEGNRIRVPQFSYSEDAIREVFARHLSHELFVAPKAAHDKIKASYAERCEEKIADFRAQQTEFSRREHECGYTDAVKIARAASLTVIQLEKDIVAFVPSTFAEAVQKAAWCAWAFRNERCYLKDAEEEDGLIAAMGAIARAVA
jgi:hypothetical protein